MTNLEAQIKAALETIMTAKIGSAEFVRAGYDLAQLRAAQANPTAFHGRA